MKGANSKFLKTSYEENNEICNYQIDKNNSDLSDERTNPNTAKSRNAATPKSEGKKRSNSKSKTKKNLTESSIKNSNLIELVESLKEKINVYDNELRNLIEEKIQMQIQINTLQLNSYQNMKKSGNKIIKTGDHLTLSNDSNYNSYYYLIFFVLLKINKLVKNFLNKSKEKSFFFSKHSLTRVNKFFYCAIH